eukprot:4895830-Amphidinium_carterae.1
MTIIVYVPDAPPLAGIDMKLHLVKLLQASQAQEPQDSDKARSLAKAKHACCVNVCAQDNDDDVCSHLLLGTSRFNKKQKMNYLLIVRSQIVNNL